MEAKEESKEGVYGRTEYAKKDFWDKRFTQTSGFFDWYTTWDELKADFLSEFPPAEIKSVLMVGCGNSKLSEDMYANGYKDITNIDISEVVIQKMQNAYKETIPEMKWVAMDATKMTFPDCSFDLVIDKGTYDALSCGDNKEILKNLTNEMVRVCKKGGSTVIITHGTPAKRMKDFDSYECRKDVDLYSKKISLSDLAQLINLLRTDLQDKPLSHALKDKEYMKRAVKERMILGYRK